MPPGLPPPVPPRPLEEPHPFGVGYKDGNFNLLNDPQGQAKYAELRACGVSHEDAVGATTGTGGSVLRTMNSNHGRDARAKGRRSAREYAATVECADGVVPQGSKQMGWNQKESALLGLPDSLLQSIFTFASDRGFELGQMCWYTRAKVIAWRIPLPVRFNLFPDKLVRNNRRCKHHFHSCISAMIQRAQPMMVNTSKNDAFMQQLSDIFKNADQLVRSQTPTSTKQWRWNKLGLAQRPLCKEVHIDIMERSSDSYLTENLCSAARLLRSIDRSKLEVLVMNFEEQECSADFYTSYRNDWRLDSVFDGEDEARVVWPCAATFTNLRVLACNNISLIPRCGRDFNFSKLEFLMLSGPDVMLLENIREAANLKTLIVHSVPEFVRIRGERRVAITYVTDVLKEIRETATKLEYLALSFQHFDETALVVAQGWSFNGIYVHQLLTEIAKFKTVKLLSLSFRNGWAASLRQPLDAICENDNLQCCFIDIAMWGMGQVSEKTEEKMARGLWGPYPNAPKTIQEVDLEFDGMITSASQRYQYKGRFHQFPIPAMPTRPGGDKSKQQLEYEANAEAKQKAEAAKAKAEAEAKAKAMAEEDAQREADAEMAIETHRAGGDALMKATMATLKAVEFMDAKLAEAANATGDEKAAKDAEAEEATNAASAVMRAGHAIREAATETATKVIAERKARKIAKD